MDIYYHENVIIFAIFSPYWLKESLLFHVIKLKSNTFHKKRLFFSSDILSVYLNSTLEKTTSIKKSTIAIWWFLRVFKMFNNKNICIHTPICCCQSDTLSVQIWKLINNYCKTFIFDAVLIVLSLLPSKHTFLKPVHRK